MVTKTGKWRNGENRFRNPTSGVDFGKDFEGFFGKIENIDSEERKFSTPYTNAIMSNFKLNGTHKTALVWQF